ncbi:hypothetical protein TL16_g06078 [Triparma laevis f. inornata]|uniref:NodB homology domain-containing protein n=1 Tax=Triparma laevis f. inornata TaxID=1714386 RepID=A0A9W7AM22_9STRA|nr:hypothetical protein TL16_g06078 [Triparma laevis f. inornata]
MATRYPRLPLLLRPRSPSLHPFTRFLRIRECGASAVLSNCLAHDGATTSRHCVPSVCFSISLFTCLLLTSNPPLHCVLPSLPFLLSYLVPSYNTSKKPTFSSKLAILAPHALLLFSLSHLIEARFSYGVSTIEHVVIGLALVLSMIPTYTEEHGIAIIALAIVLNVPKAMDFGSDNKNPIRAPITAVVLSAAFLALLWLVTGRRHRNGPMVVVESPATLRSFSIACLSSLRIVLALSAIRLSDAAPSLARDPTLVMFQMFTGAAATIMLSSFAAAVADCWYPVGSCQFQMLAWDTAGLIFYFFIPVVILFVKAWTRYDITDQLIAAGFVGGDPYTIVNGLTTTAVVIVAVGVPTLNRWSCLCSNWFAKCYQHGQPNTNFVALTVDYSELVDCDGFDATHRKLWDALKKYEARLTIFVTLEDLKRDPEVIAELNQAHSIGISSDSSVAERWMKVRARVQATTAEYFKVMGKNPLWYRGSNGHRHPAALIAASKLDIRVAFWSTYCESDEIEMSIEDVKTDFGKTRGGNIVMLRKVNTNPNLNPTHLCAELVKLVCACGDAGMKLEELNTVVKEDHEFVLE